MLLPLHKALAILRKHFTKLCACLPDDYKQTISRIKRTSVVPEGLVHQLALLPTAKEANCTILAAMIRPLGEEAHLVGFCELVKSLVDSPESKTFIETMKNGKSSICQQYLILTHTGLAYCGTYL